MTELYSANPAAHHVGSAASSREAGGPGGGARTKPNNSHISPLEMLIHRGKKASEGAPLTDRDTYKRENQGYPGVHAQEQRQTPRQADGFGGFTMDNSHGSSSSQGSSSSGASSGIRRYQPSDSPGSSSRTSVNSSSSSVDRSKSNQLNAQQPPSSHPSRQAQRPHHQWSSAPESYEEESMAANVGFEEDNFIIPNAFRSSLASDISYNSITVDEESKRLHQSIDWEAVKRDHHAGQASLRDGNGSYHLQRRNSTDTVRTEDFNQEGRFGKLWSGKASDEESLFSNESETGWDYRDSREDSDASDPYRWQVEVQGTSSPSAGGASLRGQGGAPAYTNPGFATQRGLDALHSLAKSATNSPLLDEEARRKDYPSRADGTGEHRQINGHQALVSEAPTKKDRTQVMSLTGSLHGGTWGEEEQQRRSFSSDAASSQNRSSTYTIRPGGNARDSVMTVRGEEGPSVSVWPPTPQGSINGIKDGASGLRHAPSYEAQSAQFETASLYSVDSFALDGAARAGPGESLISLSTVSSGGSASSSSDDDFTTPLQGPVLNLGSTNFSGANGIDADDVQTPVSERRMQPPTVAGPISIAHALQHPLHTPVVGPGARPRQLGASNISPADDYRAHLRAAEGYVDPTLPPGILPGSRRARAIADHDGRESMVSDLDVETLRLDGRSTRRGSFSTIRSAATIGTAELAMTQQQATQPRAQANQGVSEAQYLQQQWRAQQKEQQAAFLHQQQGRALQAPARSYQSQPGSPASLAQSNGSIKSGLSDSEFRAKRSQIGQDTKTGPALAEEYLSQGIVYHEQGDLSRSAFYFERSAKVEGGCVVGMCMWGMALREGWGARKDPRKGFEWIQRAAARAGEMSNNPVKSETELKAIRSELKLSVYELGKSYCYGWGTKMDKQTALEYFELAAKLGDADAQAEAGALYYAGKGCKKDLKKAAMYYRMAEKQGYDTVGLSWIWKEKYND